MQRFQSITVDLLILKILKVLDKVLRIFSNLVESSKYIAKSPNYYIYIYHK